MLPLHDQPAASWQKAAVPSQVPATVPSRLRRSSAPSIELLTQLGLGGLRPFGALAQQQPQHTGSTVPAPAAASPAMCLGLQTSTSGSTAEVSPRAEADKWRQCECGHARSTEYRAACELLKTPTSMCCSLRPPAVQLLHSDGSVRKLRVWPGGGGLELFRLQLQGALGMDAAADVTFVVEVPGQGEPLRLPGLGSFGVASYCAAILAALEEAQAGSNTSAHVPQAGPVSCSGAAVASGPLPPSDSGGSSSACGEDDWIELLCAVADMLEGGEDAHQPPTPAHHRSAAAPDGPSPDGHLAVWACVNPQPKPAHLGATSPAPKPVRNSLATAQASPLIFTPVRAPGSPAASPFLPVAALAGGGSEAGSDRLPLVNPRLRLKAPRRASKASWCASPCLCGRGEPGSAQFTIESAGWASVLGDSLTPAADGGRGSVDGYW